jgi:hypothetical protein
MATVNKDFRVKHGLVVQGTNATVNASDIITEDAITGGTQTNITVTYNPTTKVVNFAAENGVADSTTDNLAEGSTNKYFTDERAQDAIGNSVGTGISYNDTTGAISVDRTATDPWYDAAGSAATAETNAKGYTDDLIGDETVDGTSGDTVTDRIATAKSGAETNAQGYVDTHSELTTGVHGVTGDVVGTTDTQDLSNKRIIDTLHFTDGVTIANEAEIAVKPTTHEFEIKANYGNLDLKTVATNADVNITSQDGDIILNADGASYIGTATAGNEIATIGNIDTHSDLTTGVHGVSGDVVGTSDAQTLTNKTMGDDLLMDGNQISGLPMPDQADHAASKAYVDSVSEGLHIHASAVVATTVNINISTDLMVGDIIDGVTLAATNRVLVKNQTTASQNGIYEVQSSGAAIRALDFDSPAEVDGGDFIFVTGGDTQADTGWVQTSEAVVTIGTDPIYFTQFSGAGTFLAGNGLLLDGNTFEIDDTITATKTYVDETFVTLEDLPGELDDYVPLTQRAAADGVATLDGDAQVPLTQLEHVTDIIDGLTTADIAEDSGSLYFTDTRAVDALEAVVPNFTAIEVNSIAKQVAAIAYAPTALDTIVAYDFSKVDYRSAKFLVKVAYSTHTEVSEVLLTLDSSDNIAITEFAVVSTNGSASNISAGISGSNVELYVTPTNNSSTVTVFGTLLSEDLLTS